jgi:hypothetical protein
VLHLSPSRKFCIIKHATTLLRENSDICQVHKVEFRITTSRTSIVLNSQSVQILRTKFVCFPILTSETVFNMSLLNRKHCTGTSTKNERLVTDKTPSPLLMPVTV